MPRGSRKPSELFKKVLRIAKKELVRVAKKAEAFNHHGIRGDERAAGLEKFFSERLPSSFGLATGEAIDFSDARTGQLDLVIYEKATAAPIEYGARNLVIPCEAVYAVIEVKSVLTKAEIRTSLKAASKVRALRPFKLKFVASREGGAPTDRKSYRCLYLLFAFKSNLGKKDWLKKEFARVSAVAKKESIPLDVLDRVFVLNRGMINPARSVGKIQERDGDLIFLEFFLHVVNFLRREAGRRPSLDWQVYSERSFKGWAKIDGA